jgi:hypothetical protein
MVLASIRARQLTNQRIPMKTSTRLEELFLSILAFYLFLLLPVHWWWFFVLLLAPDASMVGYLLGPRVGAAVYNAVHHRAVSIAMYILGAMLGIAWLQAAALIVFAHSSLDRVMGYGLKYPDSFQHTHLGMIGRPAEQRSNEQKPA